ncbi:MAG: methyl-accepting chemotaxis protein [Nitrosopumilus sp.]|nr:methyl-accepting chemotaxis protein [Nitrosopumilus sp.]MDH3385246.1 methyl-accepting chemotaxis protein [Nitrosopumilus sp.]
MNKKIFTLFLIPLLTVTIQNGYSDLAVETNNRVFSEGQPLFVYGKGLPNENLIIRLFAPDETITRFNQVTTNDDGSFNHVLITWPTSSASLPFGTYTVEVISTEQSGVSQKINVSFTSTTELVDVPVERNVNTLVFAPETAAINNSFRVFVQTTSDGLLIGNDPAELLESSHVHLPSGQVETLTDSFTTLHQGLFFVDYIPKQEGTFVFHVVAFSQGTTSNGSAATLVQSQDISGISDQIIELNSVLDETSKELDTLKSEVKEFGSTLGNASSNIDASVASVSKSVLNIEEASSQLNSLLFPVVASIGIIVALQVAILARRR